MGRMCQQVYLTPKIRQNLYEQSGIAETVRHRRNYAAGARLAKNRFNTGRKLFERLACSALVQKLSAVHLRVL